jgi:4-hydroxy-2-oxoheptanedioate aldolase
MAAFVGLQERLAAKGYILNGYCAMPGAFSAELYAGQGWDAVTLDLQHGLIGYESAVAMLQAIAASGVLPLVRLPWLDPGLIMKMLDSGALGVTCPMINDAASAERLVRYAKYPPRGERSMGPIRAAAIYGADYPERANRTTSVLAMIETTEAVENIDAIAAVEGLDGIYIGPADLAVSMGKPVQLEAPDPAVEAAIAHVLERVTARGLVCGIFAPTPERAWALVERGFRFVTLSSDARALLAQTAAWVGGFRKLAGR